MKDDAVFHRLKRTVSLPDPPAKCLIFASVKFNRAKEKGPQKRPFFE
jgi:hypothetical protein